MSDAITTQAAQEVETGEQMVAQRDAQEAQESESADSQAGAAQEAQEAQEDGAQEAPAKGMDEAERKAIKNAVGAIRKGRAELMLAYLVAGYWCLQFVLHQRKRTIARETSIAKLKAMLTPEADTARESDPNYLIHFFAALNVLSAQEAERFAAKKGKRPVWADALSVSKVESLKPLVLRPEGTETWALARDNRAGAEEVWQWLIGSDQPATKDIALRVAYFLDPAKGRKAELDARVKKCGNVKDYEALIEWAGSLGEDAMLPDGRTVLAAAKEAREKAFTPAGQQTQATTEKPATVNREESQDGDDSEEEESQDGGKENPADQRGTVTGNLLESAKKATPQQLGESLAEQTEAGSDPHVTYERYLHLIASASWADAPMKRSAQAALLILTRRAETAPVKVAEQLHDTSTSNNGAPVGAA
ncbi:MAG TPA: hypothetical protein VFW33_11900 [Gemmataceae bacterium]|nr:hypothetical protein [Gemmataceae bacterium]